MTTHLLTGIVARKVVIDVIDKSSDMLSVELRNILQDLWLENLKNIGGLPVQSQQLDDVKFGLESMRKSRRLSEQLPKRETQDQMLARNYSCFNSSRLCKNI